MRLLPFLAGLASLLLFWRLAHLMLPPLARTLAVRVFGRRYLAGVDGPSPSPIRFDLCMALLLLLLGSPLVHHPQHVRWPILLCLATPLAVFSSYPVVFVAGAVSLALLATAWRQGPRPGFCGSSTTSCCSPISGPLRHRRPEPIHSPDKGQTPNRACKISGPRVPAFQAVGAGEMAGLRAHRTDDGLPHRLTGRRQRMTTFCAWGRLAFLESRRRALFVLCLAPFGLGLLAAVTASLSLGASCRLCQHFAACRLPQCGHGRRRPPGAHPLGRTSAVAGSSHLHAAFSYRCLRLVRDVVQPYRTLEALWTRQVMQALDAELRSGGLPSSCSIIPNKWIRCSAGIWNNMATAFPGAPDRLEQGQGRRRAILPRLRLQQAERSGGNAPCSDTRANEAPHRSSRSSRSQSAGLDSGQGVTDTAFLPTGAFLSSTSIQGGWVRRRSHQGKGARRPWQRDDGPVAPPLDESRETLLVLP